MSQHKMFDNITKKDCFATQKSNGKYCDIILKSLKNYWEEEPWSCEKCPFYKSVEKANADKEKADLRNNLINAEKQKEQEIENSIFQANLSADKLVIAERIRKLRQEKGLSVTALAKILNVSKQNLSRMEQGENMLKTSTLKNIADALEVDITYFTDGLKTDRKSYTNQEIYDYAQDLGVSVKEIANELGVTDSTIRRHLNKTLDSTFDEKRTNEIYDAIDEIAKRKNKI